MAENEHTITIKVNGDANIAVSALNQVRGSIDRIINVAKGAFGVIGKINWFVSGINAIVKCVKKLNDWIHRNEISARKLREELADEAYDTAIANASAAYEKLNKQLKITNELERERNAILEKRKAMSRDLEDGVIERNKQLEISKLDPTSDDYDTRKKAIEHKYEREASRLAVTRSEEDNRAESRWKPHSARRSRRSDGHTTIRDFDFTFRLRLHTSTSPSHFDFSASPTIGFLVNAKAMRLPITVDEAFRMTSSELSEIINRSVAFDNKFEADLERNRAFGAYVRAREEIRARQATR